MPQSLARIILHVVFSTKNHAPFLKDDVIRKELISYIAGLLQKISCDAICINGVEDHVHILCNLSRTTTVANMVETLKAMSSKWIKQKGRTFDDFVWQRGYGVFSVSLSNVQIVRDYIENQEEHHRKISFKDEYRLLCQKHGLNIDERYVWD